MEDRAILCEDIGAVHGRAVIDSMRDLRELHDVRGAWLRMINRLDYASSHGNRVLASSGIGSGLPV